MARGGRVTATTDDDSPLAQPVAESPSAPESSVKEEKASSAEEWPQFAKTASIAELRTRYIAELQGVAAEHAVLLATYNVLLLLLPEDNIGAFQLDQIYAGLSMLPYKEKDILLVLLSRGGIIEPAYQISKLCKGYAKEKFVVAIPRHAKSAATLIALGADEIHMGPLGQLGPIDPQLGGLPALGVTQALQTIAKLSQEYPGSADMFARYLRMAVTVEQIGYCDRVSASAVQYAERLLSTKSTLAVKASQIARELVYEYKDHGFVIDLDEAQRHLGDGWIKTETLELALAESVYRHFDWVNLFVGFHQSKRLLVMGRIGEPIVLVFDHENQ